MVEYLLTAATILVPVLALVAAFFAFRDMRAAKRSTSETQMTTRGVEERLTGAAPLIQHGGPSWKDSWAFQIPTPQGPWLERTLRRMGSTIHDPIFSTAVVESGQNRPSLENLFHASEAATSLDEIATLSAIDYLDTWFYRQEWSVDPPKLSSMLDIFREFEEDGLLSSEREQEANVCAVYAVDLTT